MSTKALLIVVAVVAAILVVSLPLAFCAGRQNSQLSIDTAIHDIMREADSPNITAAKAQISSFKTAVIQYKLQFREFPDILDALITNPKGNLLDMPYIPTDPWGNPYAYCKTEERGYEIRSAGPDGVAYTSDDILSWNLANSP